MMSQGTGVEGTTGRRRGRRGGGVWVMTAALAVTVVAAPASAREVARRRSEAIEAPTGAARGEVERRRRLGIGLLVAAGLADAAAFGVRGAYYAVHEGLCAPIPGSEALPEDTRCPRLLVLNLLDGAPRYPNAVMFALVVEGSELLGRSRADRAALGLAAPLDVRRRRAWSAPLTYFAAAFTVVIGYQIFFDKATGGSPGTRLLAPPERRPTWSAPHDFAMQAMMTVTAVGLAAWYHGQTYEHRQRERGFALAPTLLRGGAGISASGRF